MSRLTLILTVLMMGVGVPALAQQQPADGGGGQGGGFQGGGGQGGGFQGGGNFDPQQFAAQLQGQMQQRTLDNARQALTPTDDEWKVIEPRITAVYQARQQTGAGGAGNLGMLLGGGGGRGGFGGGGGGGGGRRSALSALGTDPNSEIGKAMTALNAAVDAKAADDVIQDKIKAVHEAKQKAQEKLTKAEDELRSILTSKQEAQMMSMGLLD